MLKSPCKGCVKRITGNNVNSCHARCKEYESFRREVDVLKKERAAEGDFNSYLVETHGRIQRAK